MYEPDDLEICFIGLAWLTRLELEVRHVGFLSQALTTTRSVGVYFVVALSSFILFGGLIFVLGD